MSRQEKKDLNGMLRYAAATGTDTYVATIAGLGLSAYYTGFECIIKIANASTGTSTLNVNGLGAKTIKIKGSNVAANDLDANGVYLFVYDGTNFCAVQGALA